MEYELYGDMLLQNRFPLQRDQSAAGLDTRWIEDQSREELAFGGEGTASYKHGAGRDGRQQRVFHPRGRNLGIQLSKRF